MPEIDDNRTVWSEGWDWSQAGDEWSRWWGGTPELWYGALMPRIHAYVPAATVLEIAPGYGRWTQFLRHLAGRLVIVDMTERCIEGCRQRFADATNIDFHVNDGRSLAMVEDASVDFAFSFDSLVHVEADVLEAYISQLATKLRPDGVAFLHHSNIGAYPRWTRLARRMPPRLMMRAVPRGLAINLPAWRAESVSADRVAEMGDAAGLRCISQELVNWEHGRFLIDAFSVFTRRGSRWDRPREVLRNPLFTREASRMRRLYAPTGRAAATRPGGER
jgi:SAM-dependent methyltransferase